ncbi:serine/threonine protein kinase [bacterium]|nr:serine/threonine protein kinase [bacterium]
MPPPFKFSWLVLWLLVVGGPMHAQTGTRFIKINLSDHFQLSYRQTGSNRWTPLPVHAADPTYELPDVDLEVRGVLDHGLWYEIQTQPALRSYVVLIFSREKCQSLVHWGRLFGLLLCFTAGLFMFYRRRLNSLPTTGTNQEPLIRPDGKIPKRKVGQYRLIELLGSGGMGVVYRAEAEDGHMVAIKVPAPHLVSQTDFRQRFYREIELGCRLDHPRVVKVLEVPLGEELYVVLEYVEGTPLDKWPIQPWPIECKQCIAFARQVLEALQYIHSQGVIHRDLKPANLMVMKEGSLKLMDFGIAHKIHGTRLTGTGTIMGTPIYMSPEQLQGMEIDARADLYSLGLILYERLLPGLPYSDDLMEAMRQKLTKAPAPLRDIHPNINPGLNEFICRLIAQRVEDRFQDAAHAIQGLNSLCELA